MGLKSSAAKWSTGSPPKQFDKRKGSAQARTDGFFVNMVEANMGPLARSRRECF